jgi:hypothetical protein
MWQALPTVTYRGTGLLTAHGSGRGTATAGLPSAVASGSCRGRVVSGGATVPTRLPHVIVSNGEVWRGLEREISYEVLSWTSCHDPFLSPAVLVLVLQALAFPLQKGPHSLAKKRRRRGRRWLPFALTSHITHRNSCNTTLFSLCLQPRTLVICHGRRSDQ